MSTTRTVLLIPPLITNDHLLEKITCIRAHKERIFHTALEKLDNKYIFHNYGHGGAGWTFLFGCVHQSLRVFRDKLACTKELHNKPIAVIGAGCYGLLTAIELARAGHQVRIISEHTDDYTIPSYKAAGFFFPRARKSSTPQEKALFLAYGFESYKTYLDIIQKKHAFIGHGPRIVPAYYGLDIDPGFTEYIQEGLILEPKQVIIDFGNNKKYNAREYQVVFINPSDIMHELHKELQKLPITWTYTHINNFNEIEEPIIFNCAGMGAKKLTGDPRIVPVQGHLITLHNQPDTRQLNYMINFKVTVTLPATPQHPLGRLRDELIYFAPKESGILGITFIRGQDSLTANSHEFDRLLERCRDFF